MERVIPVAPWTDLDMSCDKEKRKGRGDNEKERTNEQVTKLEMKEQAR